MNAKHLLLLLILIVSACVGSGGSGPKEGCNVRYGSSGVVISQLKPDYSKAYVGGNVRYNIEVTNLGEKRAEKVQVVCTDPSQLSCSKIFNDMEFSLDPPNPSACIEGETKQDQVMVTAQEPSGEEPAYFRVMLSYYYTSLSWAEVALTSEAQWKVRTQQGIKPVQSAYQSASPVRIELSVPDAPVVYDTRAGAANEFPVTVTLKNAFEGSACSQADSGEDTYKVDSVVLTAPDNGIIKFTSTDKCAEKPTAASPSQTCTISKMDMTMEEDSPKYKVITAKIMSEIKDEEIYKLTAVANYTYTVRYASEQGVEIKPVVE